MGKSRGKAAPKQPAPPSRLTKRQQDIADKVAPDSHKSSLRKAAAARPTSPAQEDSEDDDGQIKGEFGIWATEWMEKYKDDDPVWGSEEGVTNYTTILIFPPQPLEHCEDNLFPNAAALWGLSRHLVRKELDYSFMTKGRGPSCYIFPGSKKTPCHYHEYSFPFLYE